MVVMTERSLIPTAIVRELVSYDQTTGLLTWSERHEGYFITVRDCRAWNTRFSGMPALATPHSAGYLCGRLLSRYYLAHRVAWIIEYGSWPTEIDHINGVKSDNRIVNLRAVPHRENCRNAAIPSDNTSGVVGVSWDRSRSLWMAYIEGQDKRVHLGRYRTIEEAATARTAAERIYGFHRNHGRSQNKQPKRHEKSPLRNI